MSWLYFYVLYILAIVFSIICDKILQWCIKKRYRKIGWVVFVFKYIPVLIFLPIILPTIIMYYYQLEKKEDDETCFEIEIT